MVQVVIAGSVSQMGDDICSRLWPQDVERFWPSIVEELRKIPHTWQTWHTEESLFVALTMGHMQAWAVGDPRVGFHLCIFTTIAVFPASRILQTVLMFGNKVDKVLPLVVATLEHFAQEEGCQYAEVFGRYGWERKLSSYGYRKTASVLTKPLGALRRH